MIDFEALLAEREANTWWSVPIPPTPERPEVIHRRREVLLQAVTNWRNPHLPSPAKRRRSAERRALIQEVEFLLSWGIPSHQMAKQLGRSEVSMEKALRRAGRDDLANHFRRLAS